MSDNFWENYNLEYATQDYKYKDYLQAAIKIINPQTILEVGAGAQRNKKYIPEGIEYTGSDMITGDDITKMEPNLYYDLVISTGVFCHINPKERKKAMNFMKDSGDYLLMIEPYSNPEEMHEWHGMINKLWTVNPEKYDPLIFTILEGGYSLSVL